MTFDVTNATADRNILLPFRNKNKGNFFIFLSFVMKHDAVYAAYRALSPVCQQSLISGLVSSNTLMNLYSKFINITNSRSIIWILRTGSLKCLKKLDHQSSSCKNRRQDIVSGVNCALLKRVKI